MIDVLIISVDRAGETAGNGVVRLWLSDESWLNELATLRTVIGRPIAIHALCPGQRPGERGIAWTTNSV